MSTPETDSPTLDAAAVADTTAAAAMTPAGNFYRHLDSQQVTEFVPPNSSKVVWQIRGVEPNSGIVFLGLVNDKAFKSGTYVPKHMNQLGRVLYNESLVANVVGISVRQIVDAQTQLKNELDVSVESSSGNSVGNITSPYPDPSDQAGSVAAFTALVTAEVKLLDANEGA
jgi:hypothetical protein